MWLHLGILQLKPFSPTNLRPHRQTVPRCIYNRGGQIFTTTNGEYINQRTNSGWESFLRQLRRPLLRWGDHVVKLFSSRPQIPIRFVFFGHFWGRRRILAVFWCFCGALAVGLEPIWAKHASFFPTNRTGHWAPSTNLADRTKIWADAKPWWLYSIILDIRLLQNFCRCWSSLFQKFRSESEMWLLYGGCQKPELIQERVWGATRFLLPTILDND